ncbi:MULTISPECIES: DUF4019 domain-containing protein [unclassified Halomonas]|uniref:DUF4019 domain-containing protein n=1 Tax=unclassified Halomonas TaxID=2609666 RepID=UPI00209F873F|nr:MULTISPECIES: DUF4019 domain-containing protein [unclassified Halomonas]MCP1313686.1 DUF4019 domain-containing protein [Halomonas sp. 707D7]MCP1326047.1 DUF4019 domain-containing protein [Halomonas sp. 707D4]
MPMTLRASILSLLLIALPAHAQMEAAEAAVLAWLESIDQGDFEKAWDEASPLLQRPLSPRMLERTIELARHDFGPLEARRRVRVTSDTSMPGAPRDDYKIFTYQTRFANRASITETITPHLEEGVWRVSGYYVQ